MEYANAPLNHEYGGGNLIVMLRFSQDVEEKEPCQFRCEEDEGDWWLYEGY